MVIENVLADFGEIVDNTNAYFESANFCYNPIVTIYNKKRKNNMDLPLTSDDIKILH